MKFIYTTCIISICIATARRQRDSSGSWENKDIEDILFADKFIAMNGALRRIFALVAAIDKQNRNMICSPLSALLPLGKLAIGAKDEALDELLITIGVTSKGKLKDHFMPLIDELKYLPGVRLDIASRVYVNNYFELETKFIDRAKLIFNSSAEKIDFGVPAKAAYEINTWILNKTNGMIEDLISPTELNADSILVLVNAIYFSGKWKVPFEKVEIGTFITPTDTRKVPMMTKMSWYNYVRSDVLGAQLIEVPYEGEKASFVMLLPYKKNGLPALLSQLKLALELLDAELDRMSKVKVVLTMPKFKIQSSLDLKKLYQKIGLQNIFETDNSGLRGIVRDKSVHVTNAKQKAVIEVTDLGTEAAAASVIHVLGVSLDIHREIVNAHHPFMFFVKVNKQQLFAGTLNYL